MSQNQRIDDGTARILIVDDQLHDRQLMEILLTAEGYRLQTARSGQEALTMVREQPPDLILLDVMMPGTDGYQVTAELKANAASRNIPVILFTALDDRDARLLGLRSGAEDFLSKPIDGAELCVRVRNLLRLKTAYEELRLRNAEIAVALADAREARREAEDANAAKTHFLRVMSHELRTPLNAIAGYAQLLEDGVRGAINADQTRDLVRIRSAARYLTRLIGDVLTAERLEVARPLELVTFAVRPVLAEIEGLCTLQAKAGGLTLAFIAPREDVLVIADVERFQQILLNLVTNAIKFTPRDGRVEVAWSADAKQLSVSVTDSGIGIRSTDIDRVFDPFVQIDRHLISVAERGVGLGLAISRQLARAMGGELALQSTEGVGSVFTLTLPAATSDVRRPSRGVRSHSTLAR